MIKGEKFKRIKISKEKYSALEKQEKKIISVRLLRRVQMLKLIHLNWKYKSIAEFLGVRKDTVSTWVKIYREGGISKLLELNYRGGKGKLSDNQIAELKEKASQGKFKVAKQIKDYIEKNFNLSYHLNHVQKLAKKNLLYLSKKQN